MSRRKVWRARIFSARGKPKLNGRCTFTTRIYTYPVVATRLLPLFHPFFPSSPPPAFHSALASERFSFISHARREILFLFRSFVSTRIPSSYPSRRFGEFRAIISPNNIFARDESGIRAGAHPNFYRSPRRNILQDFAQNGLMRRGSMSRAEIRSIRADREWETAGSAGW